MYCERRKFSFFNSILFALDLLPLQIPLITTSIGSDNSVWRFFSLYRAMRSTSTTKKFARVAMWAHFFRKRTRRIYPLYWLALSVIVLGPHVYTMAAGGQLVLPSPPTVALAATYIV